MHAGLSFVRGMETITVKWADRHLAIFSGRIANLNTKFPLVLPRIINQVGNRAKTQVIRTLTKQTGLKRAVIVKAVGDPGRARPGKLSYDMVTRGGNIRLKYLDPKETLPGVVAKPFGKRTLYPGSFMRGGAFPDRKVVPQWNGHVFFRNRSKGRHYSYARSGVFIPKEMTTGATKAAFEAIAAPLLRQRVEAVLVKLL
ncbi:hypothetical protein [Kaistia nematophila]|uniref:Phage tail protein n=1 Tax=Kaistia nematophila TaxID=2994654 RepID=A0A9X3E4B7_9HYPH|nr:hypothetical protein [Kaistia nematophila]MCX5571470.1 hypothetical protein [Kaistia nematophila]